MINYSKAMFELKINFQTTIFTAHQRIKTLNKSLPISEINQSFATSTQSVLLKSMRINFGDIRMLENKKLGHVCNDDYTAASIGLTETQIHTHTHTQERIYTNEPQSLSRPLTKSGHEES